MKAILVFVISALASYLFGCLNGALLISKNVFHEDIREKGSGNAGLTNFYRVYGVKGILPVIAMDMLKMVVAVLLCRYLFMFIFQKPIFGAYWAGLWVILGHCFPCMFAFRGGKGILTASALLISLDWRIALVGVCAFILGAVLTRYISVGSILATISFPITTVLVFRGEADFYVIFALSILISATTLWSHRSNMKRLFAGNENKFQIHKKEERS